MHRLTTRIHRLERCQPPSLATVSLPPECHARVEALLALYESRWPDLAAIADPVVRFEEAARRLDDPEEAW
ncbi:MAG: hypothetical protein HRU76_03955 [Phycisphaeraceae bacterium]|nr:MAG: hypothetical protein HRU76_03955 [Phycisphaeraceae bacterium]